MIKRPRPKKILITKEGLELKQKELASFQDRRVGAVKELSIARDMGDRSENAFYKTARTKLSGIDREIRQLEFLLRNAEVTIPKSKDVIDIGSTVIVSDGKQDYTYTIVGGYESDLATGKISSFSPIGKALIGRKRDAMVRVVTPQGDKNFKIINIQL